MELASRTKNPKKSSRLVRDPELVRLAKTAKRHGLINKTVKLHGGKGISRRTAKHVKDIAPLITGGYRAQKLPKGMTAQMKRAGSMMAGSRVIRPPGKEWAERVRHGEVIETFLNTANGTIQRRRELARGGVDVHRALEGPAPPKEAGKLYGYRRYGNRSRQLYRDFETMRKDILDKYADVMDEDDNELALEEIEIDRSQAYEWMQPNPKGKRTYKPQTTQKEVERKQTYRANLTPEQRAAARQATREASKIRMRRYRERQRDK